DPGTGDPGSGGAGSGGAGTGGAGSGGAGSGGAGTGGAGTGGTTHPVDAATGGKSGSGGAGVEVDARMDLAAEAAPKDVASDAVDAGDPTETNLVGYWKFDEGSGTTLRDSSGKGNGATIANAVSWISAAASLPSLKFADGAAINFNGSAHASVGTPTLPAINAIQSITFWLNLKSTAGEQYIVCLWNQSQNAISIGIRLGQLTAWKWGPNNLVALAPPPINSWHHVAYTYDGTTHKLYLDGGTPATSTIAPNAAPVTRAEISAYNGGGFLNGQLDELRIYSVALSATQVARLAAGEFAATGP
ncbi:MAG: hypothetical protein QOI66_3524, partial [Myxococcales bacterium]|nr:hypothetical protein [Myxococcales bacterium]